MGLRPELIDNIIFRKSKQVFDETSVGESTPAAADTVDESTPVAAEPDVTSALHADSDDNEEDA
jgi:hypothetical protein